MVSGDVDEDALRQKWSAYQQGDRRAPPPAEGSKHYSKEQQKTLDTLSHVKMCMQCQAQGVLKRQYGHRVIDEVCEACDGEGCIVKKPPTLKQKIAQVEALIANAESLEDLERYEAALRSAKLEEVLPKQ